MNCLIHGLGGLRNFAVRVHCASWLAATTDLQVTIFLSVLLPRAFKEWAKQPGKFPETAYIQLDRGPDCSSRAMLALWVYLVQIGVFTTIIVSHLPRYHGHTDFDRLGGLMVNLVYRSMSCGVISVAKFLEYCSRLGGGKDEAVFLDIAIGWNAWVNHKLRDMPGMKKVRQWKVTKVAGGTKTEYRLIMSAPGVDVWQPHSFVPDDEAAETMNREGADNANGQAWSHAGLITKPGQVLGGGSGPKAAKSWHKDGGKKAEDACNEFQTAAASIVDRLAREGDHKNALNRVVTNALGLATDAERDAAREGWQAYAENAPEPHGHMINPETDIQWIDGVPACARDILAHRAGGARVRAPGSATAEPSVDLTLNPGEIPPALSDNPQIKAAQRKALKASAVAAALATPVPIEKGNFHLALDDGAYEHAREDDNVLRADFLWVVQIKTPPRRTAHRVSGLFDQQTEDAPNAVVIWWYAKTDEDACTQLQWLRDEGMDDKPPHASATFVKGGFDKWPTSLIGPRVELTDKCKLRKACRTTFADVLQRADEEYYLEGEDLDEDEGGSTEGHAFDSD